MIIPPSRPGFTRLRPAPQSSAELRRGLAPYASPQASRTGFTLIELLLVLGIISTLAGVVILAIAPEKTFIATRDAERDHVSRQISQAIETRLIDTSSFPGDIPVCTEADKNTCAKPICREGFDCTVGGGVDLGTLTPTYLPSLPTDALMPANARCTGYMVYQRNGRPYVFPANKGKAPGDPLDGTCGEGAGIITQGLFEHWKLDEGEGTTVADSWNDAQGTFSMGQPSWSTDTAPTLLANTHSLSFDGDDCVSLPDLTQEMPNGTITLWMKSPVVDDGSFLTIGRGDRVMDGDIRFIGASRAEFGASLISTGNYMGMWEAIPADAPPPNTWIHVALAWTPSFSPRLYLDATGTSIAYPPKSDGWFTIKIKMPSQLRFGCDDYGATAHYTGLLDDVRLYNRALTPAEIQKIADGEG